MDENLHVDSRGMVQSVKSLSHKHEQMGSLKKSLDTATHHTYYPSDNLQA